jgi:hypothetical protein
LAEQFLILQSLFAQDLFAKPPTSNSLLNISSDRKSYYLSFSIKQNNICWSNIKTSSFFRRLIVENALSSAYKLKDWQMINHTSSSTASWRNSQSKICKHHRSIKIASWIKCELNRVILANVAPLSLKNWGIRWIVFWVQFYIDKWKERWISIESFNLQRRGKSKIATYSPNSQLNGLNSHLNCGIQRYHSRD